jgi:hypothetical protein
LVRIADLRERAEILPQRKGRLAAAFLQMFREEGDQMASTRPFVLRRNAA